MDDRSRLFLLSVVIIPAAAACEGAPGGQVFASGEIPTDDDGDAALTAGGGDPQGPGINPGASGCEAYYDAALNCYAGGDQDEYYGTAGYGETGYGETGYSGDGGVQQNYCDDILGRVTEVYGAACAAAVDASFACLANFACQDLTGEQVSELCSGADARVRGACPGLFDNCTGVYSGGGDSCGAEYDCGGGDLYAISCEGQPDGPHVCECTVGGQQTATLDVQDACDVGVDEIARDNCGIPL